METCQWRQCSARLHCDFNHCASSLSFECIAVFAPLGANFSEVEKFFYVHFSTHACIYAPVFVCRLPLLWTTITAAAAPTATLPSFLHWVSTKQVKRRAKRVDIHSPTQQLNLSIYLSTNQCLMPLAMVFAPRSRPPCSHYTHIHSVIVAEVKNFSLPPLSLSLDKLCYVVYFVLYLCA